MKTALVAGATGLVGNQLLQLLLLSDRYSKVTALVRNKLPDHPKLNQITLDLGDIKSYAGVHADDIFCCLGTTIAKAGSKEKFKQVDFDYPVTLATAMKAAGATQYLLVSALEMDRVIIFNRVRAR